jgi:hypothetical protein
MLIVGFNLHLQNYINKKIHGGQTMKCLKSTKTGNIIRVSDKEAYNATSEWKFIPKSEWKEFKNPKKETKEKDNK